MNERVAARVRLLILRSRADRKAAEAGPPNTATPEDLAVLAALHNVQSEIMINGQARMAAARHLAE